MTAPHQPLSNQDELASESKAVVNRKRSLQPLCHFSPPVDLFVPLHPLPVLPLSPASRPWFL